MEASEPLILGRYRYIDTLGQGGSGTVELCWDTRIQRRVAIKRLPLQQATRPKDIPGLAEARTAALLSHPSIVSVYDFEPARDEALLIMEAIEGPSLAQIVDATPAGTFDIDILTSIATAVANALDFAHENQVLHLDIKPDNILITKNGTTKVSDFGISELADAQGFGEASGGTIGYMPPEQMRGLELDQRCDEFAFAMVIYEMLTGRNPYMAKSVNASLKAVERETIVAPSELRDDIDPGLDDVLLAALSADRDERYLTIYDFFDALLPYLGDAREGIAKLRDIVSYEDEPEPEHAGPTRTRPWWSRITPRQRHVAGRLLCVALCWLLGAVTLDASGSANLPTACAIALLAALAAAIKPAFGALLSFGIFGISLIISPAAVPVTGAVIIAAAICWLAFLGRDLLVSSDASADIACALSIAATGIVGLSPFTALIAGRLLPVSRAAFASLMSGLTGLVLGGITGSGSLLSYPAFAANAGPDSELLVNMAANPGTWVILFGWILSTICMSAACSRRTRVSSTFGAVAGAGLLIAAYVVAQWCSTGVWDMPDPLWVGSVALAALAIIIGGVLTTPLYDKGED